MKKFKFLFLLPLLSIILFSCNEDKKQDEPDFTSLEHLYGNVDDLSIEIGYEENAAPFITSGGVLGQSNVWSFTRLNIEALFQGRAHPNSLALDTELSEMVSIPNQNQNSYSQSELIDLATQYITGSRDENSTYISLLFVNGLYRDGSGTEYNDVLGINLGRNLVTVIFKPVINNINAASSEKANIEQATVVHELGHALGIVNNGVEMVTPHQDEDHGKHCTNQDCVMYWLNTGSSGMSSFVGSGLFSSNTVVFGQECLEDIRNY